MRRSTFLASGAAALAIAARARAQDDVDPSRESAHQSLRVLLGSGDAANAPGDTFTFDGRLYRGTYQRTADGRIVNLVDLEEYLYSVVSREMPPAWPPAALETQAICARTYVLQRSDPRREYDLVPSELDQVYDGIAGETPSGVAAVDATEGRVLTYGSAFAQVAYSSCCGGHTESSSDAWGSVSVPYLSGVVCTSCTASPNYRWSRTLALDVIGARLAASLPPLGRLTGVTIGERDASGRARSLVMNTDRGSVAVGGSAFRRGIGTRVLPSLLLASVEQSGGGAIAIAGGGLGHGVGLCQWGARGMALAGSEAPAIVSAYFPGTALHDLR
jgi:stage II sporulation protein D